MRKRIWEKEYEEGMRGGYEKGVYEKKGMRTSYEKGVWENYMKGGCKEKE